MAEVEDRRALLLMALRDLYDGECVMAERLPKVRGDARDEVLRDCIHRDVQTSESQRQRLEAIAGDLGEPAGGQENIWLRAILDDAANDAETIAAGPLRDIALTGALRKAKQSERVSYETALVLADAMGLAEAAQSLRAIRAEEQAADDVLAGVLARLCAGLAE